MIIVGTNMFTITVMTVGMREEASDFAFGFPSSQFASAGIRVDRLSIETRPMSAPTGMIQTCRCRIVRIIQERNMMMPYDGCDPYKRVYNKSAKICATKACHSELRPVEIANVRCHANSTSQISCTNPAKLASNKTCIAGFIECHEGRICGGIRFWFSSQIVNKRLGPTNQ